MAISAIGQSFLTTGQTTPLTFDEHFPNLSCAKDPNTLPGENEVFNDDNFRFKEGKVTWTEEEVTRMNIIENLQYVVIGKFSYGWPELDELRRTIPKQSVGKPIQLDTTTINKTRPSYARVKVQLELLGDLPKFVELEIETTDKNSLRVEKVKVVNAMLPKYCQRCKLQGHNEEDCRILHPELRKQEMNAETKVRDKDLSRPSREQGVNSSALDDKDISKANNVENTHEKGESGVMNSNNVMSSQVTEGMCTWDVVCEEQNNNTETGLQKAEDLDKALVIHKDYQGLHGDNLGGPDAVVLNMLEFEENLLLCLEDVDNRYMAINREKLITGCSPVNQEHMHNDKESKALIELREVRREAQKMHEEFLRKQEKDKYTLESITQELESLRSDLGELNLWIGDKKSGM
ncbi:hypothetical protein H5410_063897, partial [Solanum commersonii]